MAPSTRSYVTKSGRTSRKPDLFMHSDESQWVTTRKSTRKANAGIKKRSANKRNTSKAIGKTGVALKAHQNNAAATKSAVAVSSTAARNKRKRGANETSTDRPRKVARTSKSQKKTSAAANRSHTAPNRKIATGPTSKKRKRADDDDDPRPAVNHPLGSRYSNRLRHEEPLMLPHQQADESTRAGQTVQLAVDSLPVGDPDAASPPVAGGATELVAPEKNGADAYERREEEAVNSNHEEEEEVITEDFETNGHENDDDPMSQILPRIGDHDNQAEQQNEEEEDSQEPTFVIDTEGDPALENGYDGHDAFAYDSEEILEEDPDLQRQLEEEEELRRSSFYQDDGPGEPYGSAMESRPEETTHQGPIQNMAPEGSYNLNPRYDDSQWYDDQPGGEAESDDYEYIGPQDDRFEAEPDELPRRWPFRKDIWKACNPAAIGEFRRRTAFYGDVKAHRLHKALLRRGGEVAMDETGGWAAYVIRHDLALGNEHADIEEAARNIRDSYYAWVPQIQEEYERIKERLDQQAREAMEQVNRDLRMRSGKLITANEDVSTASQIVQFGQGTASSSRR